MSKVLFVCVRNGGKSPMAAALLRHHAGPGVEVDSAGSSTGEGMVTGTRSCNRFF